MDVSVTLGRLGTDAADFIAKPCRLLINNEWVEAQSGKRFAVFDASLPFGGYKQSGWGREIGEEVLRNYLGVKAVTAAL